MSRKNVGIWIDHHKAIIVKLDDRGSAEISELASEVSSKHRSTGGVGSSRPFWHRSVFSGNRQTNHRSNDLHKFYKNIATHINEVDHVWIFGPSTARYELANYLKENDAKNLVFDEPEAFTSRATEAQIVGHIREHFHKLAPRIYPVGAGQPVQSV